MAQDSERRSPLSAGEVEVYECYFGERRVRGKRGRGASGKTIVFGLLKRDGKIYKEIMPACKKPLPRPFFAVAWLQRVWSTLMVGVAMMASFDVGYSKHFRVEHGAKVFAGSTQHISGIDSFWRYAKRRIQKFTGVSAHTFYLHLKYSEWRFNNRSKNLYQELLTLLRILRYSLLNYS
jgi:transposase-like protein